MFKYKMRTDGISLPETEVFEAADESSQADESLAVKDDGNAGSGTGGKWRQKADKILSRFLFFWLLAGIFITPLIVVSYAFSAQGLQQLAVTAFALIGALVFFLRAFWLRQEFVWHRSPLNVGLAVLSGGIILVSLFSGRLGQIWGLAGFIPQVSPWGWLAMALLAALLIQESGEKKAKPRFILTLYALSSTLLVLFVLGWYAGRNQFLIPWGITPQAAALWVGVNAVLIFCLSAISAKGTRWFWLACGLVHAALLFFFDYDLIWYLFGGAMLLFALAQFSFRRRFGRADFIIPQLGILLAVLLLLTPSSWLFGGAQPQFWSGNLVNTGISAWRWQNYAWPDKKMAVFGSGEGLGTLALWQTAELVDMRQSVNYPLLGNGVFNLLWDGGLFLVGIFLFLLASLAAVGFKFARVNKEEGDESLPIFTAVGVSLLASLASFYFLPVTFMQIFSFLLLSAAAAGAGSTPPYPPLAKGGTKGGFVWTVGESEERRFAAALAIVAPIILAVGVGFLWTRQFQSRLAFLGTITTGAQGNPVVNVDKLQKAIDLSPSAFGYRLSRNDIALQMLSQQTKPKFADTQGLFVGLRADTQYLITQNLTGPERWQAAWQAELTAANLEFKEFDGQEKGSLNGPAKEWYQVAGAVYEQALKQITRNVILLTEVARFYRQHAALLASPDVPANNFYERSKVLANQALDIDPSYEGSYLEKIELAAITKSPADALAEIAGFAEKGPNVAYRAGLLAFAAKNYQMAAQYYGQAIIRNENHAAARYELVRSYAALGEIEKGKKELTDLENRLPKETRDNEQVSKLLKDLRASLGSQAAPTEEKPSETKPAGQ